MKDPMKGHLQDSTHKIYGFGGENHRPTNMANTSICNESHFSISELVGTFESGTMEIMRQKF